MGLCGDEKNSLQALLLLIEKKEDNKILHQQLEFYKEVKKYLLIY